MQNGVNLDNFILPAIEDFVQQARDKITRRANKDREILQDFDNSKLTMSEYALSKNINYKSFLYKLDRYRIPHRQITAQDIDRIHTRARARKAEALLK